ncbi:hypothetical protein [Rhodococcus oxybenzonivorans]|uniref:hypothetical protein n=2 Tax=Rhodococcus TaxID=1827 RepID=UPI001E63290B|nr:hypothetical protein [Rhodococcus oxybenzonivorans]
MTIRYERHGEHFAGFLHLAAALTLLQEAPHKRHALDRSVGNGRGRVLDAHPQLKRRLDTVPTEGPAVEWRAKALTIAETCGNY